MLSTPYSMDDILQGKIIYANGSINDGSTQCVSPLIPISAGTYGLKTSHNEYIGNINNGNNYKNGYGFFAADGTTIVARPENLLHSLGNDIFVFEVPAEAVYVRFCYAASRPNYYEDALEFFNQWILLPDADDNIDNSFFTVQQKKPNIEVDKLLRLDGSYASLRDTQARQNAAEALARPITFGRKTCAIFEKVCCIGDSYTSGYIYNTSGNAHSDNAYSWVEHIKNATGRYYVNCGVSGATTKTWLTSPNGLAKAQLPENKAQAYIVALQINDAETDLDIGTIADIGTSAQTYYGCTSKIIDEIFNINNDAHIFFLTQPKHFTGIHTPYREAELAVIEWYQTAGNGTHQNQVHLIDLLDYWQLFHYPGCTDSAAGGHYTGVGWEYTAEIIMFAWSEYINAHPLLFQDVNLIPYGINLTGKVTDVQINSTSIVTNGIANIPLATTSTPGVSIASGMGIKVNSLGELYLYPASSTMIKTGTNIYVPIMPTNQHESVFYGLAKAAGDTTQALSSNAVGVYTDNAKTAIRTMLGTPSNTDAIFSGTFTLGGRAQGDIGQNSMSFGSSNVATSGGSLAIGYGNSAHGASSQAIGAYCTTLGGGSTAFGYYTTTEYNNSFALGAFNYIDANKGNWISDTSYAVGDIVDYNGYVYSCVVANSDTGAPNASHWAQLVPKLFIIGNGDSPNDRSNAFTVNLLGDAYVKGNLYVGANADGSEGTRIPHDIQINGTSIVSNGVANIPIASTDLGTVKIDSDYGVTANGNGRLYINKATSSQIPLGTSQYRPIVPYNQHEAMFYGLAKAAGDSTQSASSNAVGVYTDNAKTAIQNMLAVAPTHNARFIGTFSINDNTTTPLGINSISIGGGSKAPGHGAIALGITAEACAGASIAIGLSAKTKGIYSTAIGEYTEAQYQASVAMGMYNAIDNITDWTENTVYAENDLVYVDDFVYECTTAHTSASTFDSSKWNMTLNKLFVIGNGNHNNRSNAMTVDISGNTRIQGNLYVGANADGSGGTLLAPIEVIRL